VSRRNYTRRGRAYLKRVQREADERREELTQLESELHAQWNGQQQAQAVDAPPEDGAVPVKPLEAL